MSGRSRVELADGRVVIGYRKTLRRRSAPRPLIERLHDLNEKCRKRFPQSWAVRLGFLLPRSLAPFVADGQHGIGVNAFRGFVQIAHGSFEECCISAAHFFEAVARQRPSFTVLASITSSTSPFRYGRFLTVVNGALVVSAGHIGPKVYGDTAA